MNDQLGYMTLMSGTAMRISKSLFISHSHKDKQLAAALSGAVKRVFGDRLRIQYSSSDLSEEAPRSGEDYFRWIVEAVEESEVSFVLLTPSSVNSPWISLEAGLIYGATVAKRRQESTNAVRPLTFQVSSDDMPSVFRSLRLQQKRVDKPEGIRQILEQLVQTDYRAVFEGHASYDAWGSIPAAVAAYDENVADLLKNKMSVEKSTFRLVDTAIDLRKRVPVLSENIYFERLLSDALEQWSGQLKAAEPTSSEPTSSAFRLPYVLYPEYLLRLMKANNPTIKAVAVVDESETFWQDKIAEELRLNTPETSTRVFVFRSEQHLRKHLPILRLHARRYNVRTMSYDQLIRDAGNHVYDFSIIGDIGARLLGIYEQIDLSKWIAFSTDQYKISSHEDTLKILISAACTVDGLAGANESERYERDNELIEQVFSRDKADIRRMPVDLKRMPIEMSAYIQINQYDMHEEEHAYFVEMMDRMIEICEASRRDKKRPTTILELGAGTGIFTKRLKTLAEADIVAVEIDWACFHRLQHNIMFAPSNGASSKVVCERQDSRSFDPGGPEKRFQYVMSSFADHHIKPYDKRRYFDNVKANMEKGALFIVGDEFLPPHAPHDADARRAALKAYHGHIIDIAKAKGQHELASLEDEALQSGLNEIGDFKLSCEEYEARIQEASLEFEKELIGPKDTNRFGGVYVYTLRVAR